MGSVFAIVAARSTWLVWVVPGLLLFAAGIVSLTGGGRFTAGPISVSASSASRLAFDAAIGAAAIHAL
jgi:hypothetical protein